MRTGQPDHDFARAALFRLVAQPGERLRWLGEGGPPDTEPVSCTHARVSVVTNGDTQFSASGHCSPRGSASTRIGGTRLGRTEGGGRKTEEKRILSSVLSLHSSVLPVAGGPDAHSLRPRGQDWELGFSLALRPFPLTELVDRILQVSRRCLDVAASGLDRVMSCQGCHLLDADSGSDQVMAEGMPEDMAGQPFDLGRGPEDFNDALQSFDGKRSPSALPDRNILASMGSIAGRQ